jgi:hypothetical protein
MNAGDRIAARSPREERLSFIKALLPKLPPLPTPALPPPRPPPLHTVQRTLQCPVMKVPFAGSKPAAVTVRLSLVVVASLCTAVAVWPENPTKIRRRDQVPSRAVPEALPAPAATPRIPRGPATAPRAPANPSPRSPAPARRTGR